MFFLYLLQEIRSPYISILYISTIWLYQQFHVITVKEKGSRVAASFCLSWRELESMPLPLLALACVLAVLAPEAGFGEEDLLLDPLEDLADDRVKPLVV